MKEKVFEKVFVNALDLIHYNFCGNSMHCKDTSHELKLIKWLFKGLKKEPGKNCGLTFIQ